MKYPEYKDKKVTIFGLGTYGNGPAAIRFFHENGAIITVTDLKTQEQLKDSLEKVCDIPNIKYVLGKNDESDFTNADIIFRSPAIPRENPLLKLAKDSGAKILMAEALLLKHFGTKNVIGVTGTKGKTTTATLIYYLLKGLGYKVCLAGIPSISAVELILKNSAKYEWIVLEISSWDCEGLDDLELSPSVSIITDIAQDHLNRYNNSMEAYAMSKASIFKYQKPEDYFIVSEYNVFKDEYTKLCKSNLIIFDYLANYAINSKINAKYGAGNDQFSKAKLIGEHNKKNLWAAFCVAVSQNFDYNKCLKILNDFAGVEGRLQIIGNIGETTFINDTCATAPIAVIASMKIFKDRNGAFIIGGYDKNLDYKDLVDFIKVNNVNYILLRGTATDKMVDLGLDKTKIFDDFELAIKATIDCIRTDRKGYVVLSPGAASFGMFDNEFDRGNKFNKIFEKLTKESEWN